MNVSQITDICAYHLENALHTWSVGTYGAIGEFRWDADEASHGNGLERATQRAAIRITPCDDVSIIAYDHIVDGDLTWAQDVVFCMKMPENEDLNARSIRVIGPDDDAIKPEDRDATLIDMGVGVGHVRMFVRTRDAALIALYQQAEGQSSFGEYAEAIFKETLRAQPHRILISPLARIEIYTRIPAPGERSPAGPHTHLFRGPVLSGQTHDKNAPIPEGYQPVLGLHPRGPWRDDMGERTEFNAQLDDSFIELLNRYGLDEDKNTHNRVEKAISKGMQPSEFDWPVTERARAKAQITLRRIAARQPDLNTVVMNWLQAYDADVVVNA